MKIFGTHRTMFRHATKFVFLLTVLLAVSLLMPVQINAQLQPDGERTLQDLLRRLSAVATDPENYTRDRGDFSIFLTVTTTNGDHILGIKGDAGEEYITYTISRLDSSSFCVTPNASPGQAAPGPEECFDFTQIATILFNDSTERDLQEMPAIGDDFLYQPPGFSGLLSRFRQLNEPRNNDPRAYTGYFLQFRHSIASDGDPDGLGIFVGVEYRGPGWGVARVQVISYQQDYLCMDVLRSSQPEAGINFFYCIPHSNIASVRLLRNYQIPYNPAGDDEAPLTIILLDVSDFLAAQQGGTVAVADTSTLQTQDALSASAEASTDVVSWWQSGETTPLTLQLRVPISEQGSVLTVARSTASGGAAYIVTEVGEGYLCLAPAESYTPSTVGELCTTFDNIVQARPIDN